jgi:hypothetical protein
MTTKLSDELQIGVSTRRPRVDAWAALAAAVGATLLVGAARPLADPDVWWHVRTGELIVRHGIPHVEPWAFTAVGRRWTPTAWFSDVTFAEIHSVFGWRGLIALKVILGALLLVSLFELLLRHASARLAAPVFILVAITLSSFIAERPQLISLCFVVWLASRVRTVHLGGTVSWWIVPITYVWANFHGMWILSPLCLLCAAAGVAVDRRADWRAVSGRATGVALVTLIASLATPVGPPLAISALAVRRAAAADVSEWQPTNLLNHYSVFFLALMFVWVHAVARSRISAPRSEVLWMGVLFVFALAAARNVAPAAILASPFVVLALERAYGPELAKSAPAPEIPRPVLWIGAASALVAAVILIAIRPPLVAGLPSHIVAELQARPGQVRVLNSYVVGGYLTGAGAPHISVAIDGRTENYDPDFVHRYFLATNQTVGWRRLVADLRPNVVVVGKESQLATELRHVGWRTTIVDGDFALLDPPQQPQ